MSSPQPLANPEMDLADQFIRNTGCHLFLTGKAGTGKTTFLHRLKANTDKQLIVTAPTGVAAVNAGGVTLHSFFQLPFGPYLPGRTDPEEGNRRFFRFSKEKKRIIKGLDLLVIDEISMVRADLLDAVDAVLRRLRRDERPFGGVQLLLIGDLFQLPPVAKAAEWELLRESYPAVYFFASQALSRTELITIELKKIYRQSDPAFISLLNKVRENSLDREARVLLDACSQKPAPEKGCITLTTHNKKAAKINSEHLEALEGTSKQIQAEVDGEFPEHAFPTPDCLVLKKGAQVMFLRNDPSPEKQYFNGKIGRVSSVEKDKVMVEDPQGDNPPVEVTPVEWENIAYKVNETDQTIEEKIIGRFSQVPLKLAWAVTIHKSQGLTFDRAVIDAEDAFAHGQTYVALSRCRCLEGLVLSSPLPERGVMADPDVAEFMTRACAVTDQDYEGRLQKERTLWQQGLLFQCFDFSRIKGLFYYFLKLARTHRENVRVSGLSDLDEFQAGFETHLAGVGDKFKAQLRGMMGEKDLPDSHPGIQERTQKAAAWFHGKIQDLFGSLIEKGGVETDNKSLKKQMGSALENLIMEIRIIDAGISSCSQGFSSSKFLRAISAQGMAAISPGAKKKVSGPDYSESDIAHPQLFQALKRWRADMAEQEGLPHFRILHQKVLVQIAVCLPHTRDTFSRIKGVGPVLLEKYGDELVDLVKTYRKEHQIETVTLPEKEEIKTPEEKSPQKGGPSSREISLTLFESGLSAQAVAEERSLALSTIEGHLIHFIETGRLPVDKLVDKETCASIEAAFSPGTPLGELKEKLGRDISYTEIRAVLAHQKSKKKE